MSFFDPLLNNDAAEDALFAPPVQPKTPITEKPRSILFEDDSSSDLFAQKPTKASTYMYECT
jgi:hypothetical protein